MEKRKGAMLTVHLETLCFIISKAREFQAKEQVVIPETPSSPSDDWAMQVLADHIDDMSLLELKATVEDLIPEQQAELVALMWLGRGDYAIEEWDDATTEALEQYRDKESTTEYLLAHPMISDYLEEGIIAHGYSCED
jgi:hypothetical protein